MKMRLEFYQIAEALVAFCRDARRLKRHRGCNCDVCFTERLIDVYGRWSLAAAPNARMYATHAATETEKRDSSTLD